MVIRSFKIQEQGNGAIVSSKFYTKLPHLQALLSKHPPLAEPVNASSQKKFPCISLKQSVFYGNACSFCIGLFVTGIRFQPGTGRNVWIPQGHWLRSTFSSPRFFNLLLFLFFSFQQVFLAPGEIVVKSVFYHLTLHFLKKRLCFEIKLSCCVLCSETLLLSDT